MRGIEEKARSRLPATASVGVVVKTDVHGRHIDAFAQFPVDLVDHLRTLQPPGHVRLVRDDHQGISGNLQPTNRGCGVRVDLEVLHRIGWVRPALAEYRPVDYPVTVEEHRRLARSVGPS